LALPRDVEPGAAGIPGVHVVDLETLSRDLAGSGRAELIEQARTIVAQEVAAYLTERRAQAVAPTVIALRARAREVVEAELARLDGRVPDLDPTVRAEIELTVHRVVEKLLHTPTVRIKELAGAPGGDAYADALRALFDLDTAADLDFDADRERLAALSFPLGPLPTGGAA
ncbi:MAG: glutamyl-tRNA reductase, partial [Kineosporiaceae bacterium]